MTEILILGADGQIARAAMRLVPGPDRRAANPLPAKRTQVEGRRARRSRSGEIDAATIEAAISGQDAVYANLSGRLEPQGRLVEPEKARPGGQRRQAFQDRASFFPLRVGLPKGIAEPLAAPPATEVSAC